MLERLRAHAQHLALALALVTMSGLMLWGSRHESPTEDELTHMVRGIAYWQSHDTRLSYGHPALGNAWTALPVAFDANNPRIDSLKGWQTATAAKVAKAYVEQDYGRARAQLLRARLAAMALGLLLVSYVYYWCLSIFGLRTALVVLVLTAFNPVVIAQCRYVTTDPPAMLGFAIGVGELVRYLRGAKYSAYLMPLGLSLGLLTKYSGVILVPYALGTAAIVCGLGRGRFAGLTKKARWLGLAKDAGIAVVITTLCINVAYKFNDTGMSVGAILDKPEPQYWVSSRYDDLLERFTPLPKLPRALPIPVPYTYIFGIAGIRGHTTAGFTSFYWGEKVKKAPLSYFPVMLGIKNPPSLLLLLAAGLVLLVRRKRLSLESSAIAAGAAAFMLVATRSNLAMGVRHVLPVIPLLSILAGRSFEHCWELLPKLGQRYALCGLVGTTCISAVTAGPDFLGYFNLFAGGRKGGHRISIYGEDWGQDREKLADFVRERKLAPLYYDPMTATRALEAKYLKLPYKTLRCGMKVQGAWVAVHALSYRTRDLKKCYPFLRGRKVDLDVNDHIYLFKIPKAEKPQAEPERAPAAPSASASPEEPPDEP